ncbi:MAG: 3-oxoacyl-ACP reductase FabG [Deltaproteobacteria bacterium]|nr:3-oxoacyl-ACP reductase FabG [Deltaproteobacteria bacterium]
MVSKPIDLSGRKAIVTGSSRGIGAAAALVLAREGADVALADLMPADETAREVEALGRKAVQIKVDVSNAADVKRMVAEAIDKLGRIDILVNNAGIVHREGLTTTSEEIWDRVMSIDLKGTFLCIQAVYPHMKERGYGKIVNVSSISGIIGGAVSKPEDDPDKVKGRSGPAYAAAKGGVIALTRWIAKDVAKDGIYVNSIAPGACETDMTRGYDYGVKALPIARMGSPYDMAEAILFLASCASDYITGQILNVDGGWVMA